MGLYFRTTDPVHPISGDHEKQAQSPRVTCAGGLGLEGGADILPPRALFSELCHRAGLKDQTPPRQHFINILI